MATPLPARPRPDRAPRPAPATRELPLTGEDDRRLARMLGATALLGLGLWAVLGWGAWRLVVG